MNRFWEENKGSVTAIGAIITGIMIVSSLSAEFFDSQLSLISYATYVFVGETITSVCVWMMVLIFLYNFVQRVRDDVEIKHKPLACTIAVIALIIINICAPLSSKYQGINVSGRHPSRVSYYSLLVKDIVDNETQILNNQKSDIFIGVSKYKRRVGRVLRTYEAYTFNYKGKDGQEYSCYINDEEKRLFNVLMDVYEDINVEYYTNSGMIKSINGINLKDGDTLLKQAALYQAVLKGI